MRSCAIHFSAVWKYCRSTQPLTYKFFFKVWKDSSLSYQIWWHTSIYLSYPKPCSLHYRSSRIRQGRMTASNPRLLIPNVSQVSTVPKHAALYSPTQSAGEPDLHIQDGPLKLNITWFESVRKSLWHSGASIICAVLNCLCRNKFQPSKIF